MATVSSTSLHRLRERLAQEFESILKHGEAVEREDGQVVRKKPSPAMFNVIRQFLKDNGIDREPIDVPRGNVLEALPFVEEENSLDTGDLPQHLLGAVEAQSEGETQDF